MVSVLHASFSASGGAGWVAQVLVREQNLLGLDARLISNFDGGIKEDPLAHPLLTTYAAIDANLVSKNTRKAQVSLYRRKIELFSRSEFSESEIIHLHWLEGALSHQSVRWLLDSGKRVTWTLHDMAPFTGGCHQSLSCENYKSSCEACPQVRVPFQMGIRNSLETRDLFSNPIDNLTVVAPTKWLADKARVSRLFQNQRIEVIPNPISTKYFSRPSQLLTRSQIRSSRPGRLNLILIANDLNDPNKNVGSAVSAVDRVRKKSRSEITLTLVGQGGKRYAGHGFVSVLGPLEEEALIEQYDLADLLLSVSFGESFGLTIAEAAARSVPAIVFAGTGSEELVTEGESGWVANNEDHLVSLLQKALSSDLDIAAAGVFAQTKANALFRPDLVAQNYMSTYNL
jgi:glycosyltransferase involved in cell wall biosynthesis